MAEKLEVLYGSYKTGMAYKSIAKPILIDRQVNHKRKHFFKKSEKAW